MIEKGISRIGRPLTDINSIIENVGRVEVAKLEKDRLLSLADERWAERDEVERQFGVRLEPEIRFLG